MSESALQIAKPGRGNVGKVGLYDDKRLNVASRGACSISRNPEIMSSGSVE